MAWTYVSGSHVQLLDGAVVQSALDAIATTSGNLLVLGANITSGGIAISSITDTAGNTWQTAPNGSMGSGDKRCHVWYAENIATHAANVVTINWSAGTGGFRIIFLEEYSNNVGACVSVGDTGATNLDLAAAGTIATTSFTPAGSGNLNVAMCGTDSGATFTAGSGYTLRGTLEVQAQLEDNTNASSGSQTAAFTWTGTTSAAIACGSFKPPVAAGRTTKNTRAFPLGMELGMGRGMGGLP